MTQSAVSQHVKNLELDLGTTLIDRSNRREIRLTESGRLAYEYARRILQIEEEMRHRIDDITHVVRGTLRIGASYTVGEYILPRILTEFRDLYPEIEHQVEIYNTPMVVQALAERRLDVGLVESTVTQKPSLHVEMLTEDELLLIVPARHRIASMEHVDASELDNETWIVREQGSGTREFTDALFETLGINPNRVIAFSSTHAIKEAVRAGLGIALISSWAIETERTPHSPAMLRLRGISLSRPLSVVTLPSAITSNASNLFADFVRKRFKSGLDSP